MIRIPEPSSGRSRYGITIVELLVTIAILGTLAALLLPAVQNVREAARQTQCRNRLRQIGLAADLHTDANGHYPTNGWGFLWVGMPDRGTGPEQPGGWIYNLLPYLEQTSLREAGGGLPYAAQRSVLTRVSMTGLEAFQCPGRPSGQTGPAHPSVIPVNADWVPVVAKTDYAINEGDHPTGTDGGPNSVSEGDSPGYPWTSMSEATGVSFLRSRVRRSEISDGLTNTILAGEKNVTVDGYLTSSDPGNDQSMYSGVDWDVNRWTTEPPIPDGSVPASTRFGSAHASGCQVIFCDGHVAMIAWSIDQNIFRLLGNREDGEVISYP